MTYKEIIMRASLAMMGPNQSLAQFTAKAETLFPSVEEELAIAVAMNPLHPWRRNISDVTTAIISGGLIPLFGAGTLAKIIGKYGQVTDFTDGKQLTEGFVLDELRRLVENPGAWRVVSVYAYQIIQPRIFHTRTSVKIDVCVYDAAAQQAAIASNALTLFPSAEGAYVTALIAKLKDPTVKFDVDLQGQVMLIENKA